MADDTPLEPWPGYAALSPADRLTTFKAKEQEARMRYDQAYALALSAAVGNYERLLKLDDHDGHDADTNGAARDLHDNAGSWVPN
jgi:hypothetical protein